MGELDSAGCVCWALFVGYVSDYGPPENGWKPFKFPLSRKGLSPHTRTPS